MSSLTTIRTLIMSISLTSVLSYSACASATHRSPASARVGGSDGGGGGNICFSDGQVQLLELAGWELPSAQKGLQFPEEDKSVNLVGHPVRDLFARFGFSEMQMRTGRLKLRLEQIFANNRSLSPDLTTLLESGFLRFDATNFQISIPLRADFSDSKVCSRENTRASIVYANSQLAYVDVAKFNLLDLDSQVGLYIHENLRFIQDSLQRLGGRIRLSDLDLQRLTRQIVYHPAPLDQSPWLNEFFEIFPAHIPSEYSSGASCDLVMSLGPRPKYTSQVRVAAREVCLASGNLTTPSDLKKALKNGRAILLSEQAKNPKLPSLKPFLNEIAQIEMTLTPAHRRQFILDQVRNGRSGNRPMARYFEQFEPAALGYYEYVAALKAVDNSENPTLKQLQCAERAQRLICNQRENLRDFMRTGDLKFMEPGKLSNQHPRCSGTMGDTDDSFLRDCHIPSDQYPDAPKKN